MRAITLIRTMRRDQRGATSIEYGLIVALICLAIMGAVKGVANENTGMWARVEDKVTAVMNF